MKTCNKSCCSGGQIESTRLKIEFSTFICNKIENAKLGNYSVVMYLRNIKVKLFQIILLQLSYYPVYGTVCHKSKNVCSFEHVLCLVIVTVEVSEKMIKL